MLVLMPVLKLMPMGTCAVPGEDAAADADANADELRCGDVREK